MTTGERDAERTELRPGGWHSRSTGAWLCLSLRLAVAAAALVPDRPAGPGEGPVAYVGQNVNVTAAYRKSTSFDGPVSSMKSPEKKWE